jgi:hypothetical protein
LERGADSNSAGANRSRPVEIALINGDAKTVRILLDHGAKIPRDGMLRAIAEADIPLIQTLLDHGSKVPFTWQSHLHALHKELKPAEFRKLKDFLASHAEP